ncbi:MAG: glycosyltransferase family 4 protein [Planctomycetes bacterium]|nr:glycosyltransferase family 4 protein [Planctomycetota bacterium]
MRVLLISTYFIQYGIELANGLAEAGAEVGLVFNHENAVQLVGEDYRSMLSDKVQLKLMPKKHSKRIIGRAMWTNKRWFTKMLNEFQPDVMHFQISNDLASIWTAWQRRNGLVVTIHDINPHPGDDETNTPGWLTKLTDHFVIPHSRKFGVRWITHGKVLREELHRKYHVDLESIDVIPHGILAGYSAVDGAEAPAAKVPTTSADAVGPALFFGRMEKYKGLSVLADAIPLVLEQMPEARFVIAGRGPALEPERAKLTAHPQVELKDYYIETAEVAQLFRNASINLAPYIEASQSGVIASGYAFDVPAVASRLGALPEVVIHEENGLLVEPNDPQALADAILRLMQDREFHRQMQVGVRRWAEGPLSWQSIAGKTLECYALAGRKK